ncbi:hypothetical protein NEOKW01_2137, partial [Nematocida sp. AWRm80]
LRQLRANHVLCDFDAIKKVADFMIVMTYVKGVKDPRLRYSLLKEADLTAAKAEEITTAYISTTEATNKMNGFAPSLPMNALGIHEVGGNQRHHKSVAPGTVQGSKCYVCGGIGHKRVHCPSTQTHKPNKKSNHRSAAPKNVEKRWPSKRAHKVETGGASDIYYGLPIHQIRIPRQASTAALKVHEARPELGNPPRMIEVRINDQLVRLEIDSGAEISILGERDWRQLGQPKLSPMGSVTSYGTEVPMMGCTVARVALAGLAVTIPLAVARGMGRISLFGRDLIQKLNVDMGPYYRAGASLAFIPCALVSETKGVGAGRSQKKPVKALNEQVAIPNTQSSTVKVRGSKEPPAFPYEAGSTSGKQKLQELLVRHANVFAPGKGRFNLAEATLVLTENAKPRVHQPRRVPLPLRPLVNDRLDKMVKEGTLKPVKWADWQTPLVVVPKPGGKVRICGDFKVTLNPCLKIDTYPIPVPEDLFAAMNGGRKFTKLDLTEAYLQLPLDRASRRLVTVTTQKGLFEFQVLPFGVASAPAIFQRMMETTLAGIDGVMVYLDDILVTGRTDEDHLLHVDKVLGRLGHAGLKLRLDKCEFFMPEIQYLGHIVDAFGVRPVPDKVKATVMMPEPKNLKELQAFIGMVGYYGKFIPKLSALCAPLNVLRNKDVAWTWGPEQQEAVRAIKAALSDAGSLAHYDPNEEVVLATDASDYGLGAVLYHKYKDNQEKVIANASRVLTKSERNYSQIEKEALGIVWGVEKFNHYVYGRRFTLLTDHEPLVRIFGNKADLPVVAARRVHRWAVKLSMYSFHIQYVRTAAFGHADVLSRLPLQNAEVTENKLEELRIHEIVTEQVAKIAVGWKEMRSAVSSDPNLTLVRHWMKTKWPEAKGIENQELRTLIAQKEQLSLSQEIVLYGEGRLVVPKALRPKLLSELHRTHAGGSRMKALARVYVWYPGIDKDIERVAATCQACAIQGPEPTRVALHPWEIPTKVWQRIHIDHAGPFLGHTWLIIVDAKSKWPEVVPVPSTASGVNIAELRRVFACHGYPEILVSDNGTCFTSQGWAEFMQECGIEHVFTPPYHPQSNGEAERFVRTFKEAMKKAEPNQRTLGRALSDFLMLYRVTAHPATGVAPCQALMGRLICSPIAVMTRCMDTKAQKEKFSDYCNRMKRNFDKTCRDKNLAIGDPVYTRNYREGDKWIPGQIVAKLGKAMFAVETQKGTWSRHYDQLKVRYSKTSESEHKAATSSVWKPDIELEGVVRDEVDKPVSKTTGPVTCPRETVQPPENEVLPTPQVTGAGQRLLSASSEQSEPHRAPETRSEQPSSAAESSDSSQGEIIRHTSEEDVYHTPEASDDSSSSDESEKPIALRRQPRATKPIQRYQ